MTNEMTEPAAEAPTETDKPFNPLFIHFGNALWERHKGILTVGALPITNVDSPVWRIAFAHCAPEDPFRRHDCTDVRWEPVPPKNPAGDPKDDPDARRTRRQLPGDAHSGGLDIVRARLGLIEKEGYGVECYDLPYDEEPTIELVKQIIDFYNDVACPVVKPRVWARRCLCVGPHALIALVNSEGYGNVVSAIRQARLSSGMNAEDKAEPDDQMRFGFIPRCWTDEYLALCAQADMRRAYPTEF